MIVAHILTEGFVTPNGRAFLIPILYHDATLRSLGIRCQVFCTAGPGLTQCDVLIVDSKFYRQAWAQGTDAVLEQLHGFRQQVGKLLWFDTTDSAGTLQAAVLPVVDRYYKGQLLKDCSLYRHPLYGGRLYTDYYHTRCGVSDAEPECSTPVCSDEELKKLGLSWNSGLANYSLLGPFRAKLYPRLCWKALLKPPERWVPPSPHRKVKVSARFGISYPRATVRYQRERIRELLVGQVDTKKLKRRAYFREMEQAKVAVSPFGLGEITLRDFEAFLSGCLLIKPDMGHLGTWPDLFQSGVTVLTHQWELGDFHELIEEASRNYEKYLPVADFAQKTYKGYLVGNAAAEAFASRFRDLIG